jgi:hypothetical protein
MSDKVRKPRTATERPLNKLLAKNPKNDPTHCPYDDDTKWKECGREWADKCEGNIFKCKKLKLQHLASRGKNKPDFYEK